MADINIPPIEGAEIPTVGPARGSVLVSAGSGLPPVWQIKSKIDVRDYGGSDWGDGTTDDTPMIQAAIDAASHTASVGTEGLTYVRSQSVVLPVPDEFYNITGPLTIASRAVMLEGASHEGAVLRFTAAAARINVTAPYVKFRDLFLFGDGENGAPVASHGIVYNDPTTAGEFILDGCSVYNFTNACVDITQGSISRLLNNCKLVNAPVLLRLTNTSAVAIEAGNFFQLAGSTAAIEVRGSCSSIAFQGGWAEGFQNFLLVANANGAVNHGMFVASGGVRFTSTRTNARVVKVASTVNGTMCRAVPIAFRDCVWNLTATTAMIEVDLSDNTDPNSGLSVLLDNVALDLPPSTALAISDVTSTRLIAQHVIGVPPTAAEYLSGSGSVFIAGHGGEFAYEASALLGGQVVVTYDAGNFTTNGAGGWQVADDDEIVSYSLVGTTRMLVNAVVVNSTVTAATGTELRILIPGGYTAPTTMGGPITAYEGAGPTPVDAYWQVAGSGSTQIILRRTDGAAWTATTDTTNLLIDAEFTVTPP